MNPHRPAPLRTRTPDAPRRRPRGALLATAVAALLGFAASVAPAADDSTNGTPPAPAASHPAASVLLVVGAEGESEYGTVFAQQTALWQAACRRAGINPVIVGNPGATNPAPAAEPAPADATHDLARLRDALDSQPREGNDPLWLVLIGHGTFDGKEPKFNLRGPDLTASNLAVALQPFRRPIAVLNTAPASAPFLPKLAASNRVVIAATRSGYEQNFTRLGSHLAATIADPAGDLDQDGQTSLLEAFLAASFKVAEFYKTEGRMATEHALIDDNGDGLGTPAEWFRGLRATRRPRDGAAVDGLRAHQFHLVPSPAESALSPVSRHRRDELERELAGLRDQRADLGDDAYFAKIEPLLLELARLYTVPAPPGPAPASAPAPAPASAPAAAAAR